MKAEAVFQLKTNYTAYTERLYEMLKADTSYDPAEIMNRLIDSDQRYVDGHTLLIYMIVHGLQYNRVALDRYMDEYYSKDIKTSTDFFGAQANYPKFYYEEECRAKRKKISKLQATKIWNENFDLLMENHRHTAKNYKKAVEDTKYEDEQTRIYNEKYNRSLLNSLPDIIDELDDGEVDDCDSDQLIADLIKDADSLMDSINGDIREREEIAERFKASRSVKPPKPQRATKEQIAEANKSFAEPTTTRFMAKKKARV